MPTQETAFLYDKAILWEYAGVDENNEPVVLTPYEIPVRWEQTKRQTLDKDNNVLKLDACILGDQNIPIGSILWHGMFLDLPSIPTNLYQVVTDSSVDDIRVRSAQYSFDLIRFGNTLPTIVGTG